MKFSNEGSQWRINFLLMEPSALKAFFLIIAVNFNLTQAALSLSYFQINKT